MSYLLSACTVLLASSASGQMITSFHFSVDIGSDMAFSDPNRDGDEILDPGDTHIQNTLLPPAKDDILIFGFDPSPMPPISISNAYFLGIETLAFDLDGEDQLDIFFDNAPIEPIIIPPGRGLYPNPNFIVYSLDDDDARGWYAPGPGGFGDVPVNSLPDNGPGMNEVLGAAGWPNWGPPAGFPILDETGLGLNPDPGISQDDDDVDALDGEVHQFWYWSSDHEARMNTDPGTIYVTDLALGGFTTAFTPMHLGIPPGTDVDAFEFIVTDDPAILGQFGLPPAGITYLAILFSVDEDDPITAIDESGGLPANGIFISVLNGFPPLLLSLREAGEDVDALTVGEYVVVPEPIDFGDAPDPGYPTLLVNQGASHTIMPGIQLGLSIDAEVDGQPDATATGDDLANLNDEDGILFPGPIQVGGLAPVDVMASVRGFVYAWVDFNANSSWGDSGERIFYRQAVTAGVNNLTFSVPATAVTTQTFARFRFTTNQLSLSYTGVVDHGEVEDYQVNIRPADDDGLDFGDANDPTYPTLLVANGARHQIVPGVLLGKFIDAEPDGQPDGLATGDDTLGIMDDEDGVVFPPFMLRGQNVTIPIIASTNGFVSGWIDFAVNGDWNDPFEHVFNQTPVTSGVNFLQFMVPPFYPAGGPQARFRFVTNLMPGLSYTGFVDHGEVEDYEVFITDADFGDAPLPYPTRIAQNGAQHLANPALKLGTNLDWEVDGQPDPNALGDDSNGVPNDEDGVTWTGPAVRGSNLTFAVRITGSGLLSAWIDYTFDGDWLDPGEQVATDLPVATGLNNLPVTIPLRASVGPTFMRFRLSSTPGLSDTGVAPDGEVEDYAITICQNGPSTNIVITNIVYNLTNSNATVWWHAETDVVYQVQSTLSLLATQVWNNVGGPVHGPMGSQVHTNAPGTRTYYRVSAPFTK